MHSTKYLQLQFQQSIKSVKIGFINHYQYFTTLFFVLLIFFLLFSNFCVFFMLIGILIIHI
jgi:hypothetical protein